MPLLLALLACVCPTRPCPAWMTFDVRPEAWDAGTWRVVATGEGVSLDCTVRVDADVGVPTLADVACAGGGLVAASVLDTAGLWADDGLVLRAPVTPGLRPESVDVAVTWTPEAGGEAVTRLAGPVSVTWRAIPKPRDFCVVACEAADVSLAVPQPLQSTAPSGRK